MLWLVATDTYFSFNQGGDQLTISGRELHAGLKVFVGSEECDLIESESSFSASSPALVLNGVADDITYVCLVRESFTTGPKLITVFTDGNEGGVSNSGNAIVPMNDMVSLNVIEASKYTFLTNFSFLCIFLYYLMSAIRHADNVFIF